MKISVSHDMMVLFLKHLHFGYKANDIQVNISFNVHYYILNLLRTAYEIGYKIMQLILLEDFKNTDVLSLLIFHYSNQLLWNTFVLFVSYKNAFL